MFWPQMIHTACGEAACGESSWSWSCFAGFSMLSVAFVFYSNYRVAMLDVFCFLPSVVNAAYLCCCTCRQKTFGSDIVEDMPVDVVPEGDTEDKTFCPVIEQKTLSIREGKLLLLDSARTCKTLCQQLSIGRTCLSMCFTNRGATFHHYINSIRVGYAKSLLLEKTQVSIREISELSDFCQQTIFRRVFQEVMGRLQMEIRRKKD